MASSTTVGTDNTLTQPSMPYTCVTCSKRKVKCDKASPICSSCQRGKLPCSYQAPPPRGRKRKASVDLNEKVAQYEQILRQHGLMPRDTNASSPEEETRQDLMFLRLNEPEVSNSGKLLSQSGKSRYVNSNLWRNIGDEEIERLSDEDEDDYSEATCGLYADPLTAALTGYQQDLLDYHPSHGQAMKLWDMHVTNVEPICKVLHIPTMSETVRAVSQQPALASKAEECLLFAIYHFAIFSASEDECTAKFGQPRAFLLQGYHFAARQALVNASFLKTTEMSVLQALTLFLMVCRYQYDPHVQWILTGVASRIAQRMGLHRDGEQLELPPFEVQMRRRLWYQVIPLDGGASMISGTGLGALPSSWDTQQPLNVNDDQIWPGMTEHPKEQEGATDMIFCLLRSTVGKIMMKDAKSLSGFSTTVFRNYEEAEAIIRDAEREIEEKFIRYCDIINPLHLLTIGMGRSAILTMRLRLRLPKVRNKTITTTEQKDLLQIALKILDTDTATSASSYPHLRRYQWHTRSFFVFGSWDSLILVLTTLSRKDLLSPSEAGAIWSRLEQLYRNHDELLVSKRALQVAIRRLTLEAWHANPPANIVSEPSFITSLHAQQQARLERLAKKQMNESGVVYNSTSDTTSGDPYTFAPDSGLTGSTPDEANLGLGKDFNLETADWGFWENMIKDYQAQGA